MKQAASRMVSADFGAGWIYSRHRRSMPQGAVSDGVNMVVLGDEIVTRDCYERAYTNYLAKRTAAFKTFYLPTGYYVVLAINTDGSFSWLDGMSESGTWTNVSVTTGLGVSEHADAKSFREGIWMTTGCTRPIRFVPSWPGGGNPRYQLTGCNAPLFSGSDTAIATAVELGGAGGLAAGHYYYAMTLLYGDNGKWGESRPGAVGQVTVTATYDGTARIVDTGAGLPAASTSYVPATAPYYGAWGRRLYRTKVNGDRNGPYYFVQQVSDMSTTDFEDNLNDAELSDILIPARYLDDDEQLPPVAEFIELHEGRMVYVDSSHVWWSNISASGEPVTDEVHSVRNVMNLPVGPNEWVTGCSSLLGTLIVPTNRRLFLVGIGSGAGSRVVDISRGCVAKKSWCPGRNGVFFLSTEGPAFFDMGQTTLLGGTKSAQRINHYLEDYCNNLELCCGAYQNGRYYLSYPDRRDSPPPENSCTRTLVWDDNLRIWDVPWDVPMNCMVPEDSRMLWMDGLHASRNYVMQFNPSLASDFDTATVATEAPTFRARFGNLSGNETADFSVPIRALVRGNIPSSATVTATAYYDDVAATAKTLSASGMTNPVAQVYPMAPKIASAVEFEIKSVTSGGPWSVASLDLEMGDTL